MRDDLAIGTHPLPSASTKALLALRVRYTLFWVGLKNVLYQNRYGFIRYALLEGFWEGESGGDSDALLALCREFLQEVTYVPLGDLPATLDEALELWTSDTLFWLLHGVGRDGSGEECPKSFITAVVYFSALPSSLPWQLFIEEIHHWLRFFALPEIQEVPKLCFDILPS